MLKMLHKHRVPAVAVCAVAVFSMLLLGCDGVTPEVVTVPVTVVVTPTAPEATMIPEPTLPAQPATSVPPSPVQPTTSLPPSATPELPTLPPATATAPPTAIPDAGLEGPYDDRGSPVALLASYFNAVNRREYQRAWEYWEDPPNPSYEDFVQGYADTASVLVALRPPTLLDGAAGSVYAAVPTLLIATHVDSSQHAFVGCYVTRRPNIGGDVPPDWSLYDATVARTPGNATDATLLADACDFPPPDQPELRYDDREYPTHVLASYFNAVNRREYERAWEYWENPPNPSYEDFVQGYAETESVLLVVRPPTRIEGAVGSLYAEIPTLLIATHTDASQHTFAGCYVTHRPNPEMGGALAEEGWSLFSAAVTASPGNATDATLLAGACATQ